MTLRKQDPQVTAPAEAQPEGFHKSSCITLAAVVARLRLHQLL